MRIFARALVAFLTLAAAFPPTVGADGGAVVGQAASDALAITVFAAPAPLRVGGADVSVLVQSADAETPILDAVVSVKLSSDGEIVDRMRADHATATNKLLYAARLEIPAPGAWQLEVDVEHEGRRASLDAVLAVAPGPAPATRFWGWFLFPIVVVGVFLLHQWLNER